MNSVGSFLGMAPMILDREMRLGDAVLYPFLLLVQRLSSHCNLDNGDVSRSTRNGPSPV